MVLDFLGIPAAANAEEKAPARDLIYRGNELCRLDRIPLGDEAHPGPDLQPRGRHRRGGQRHERVHRLGIFPRQFAALRERRRARGRDVRVLRRPY